MSRRRPLGPKKRGEEADLSGAAGSRSRRASIRDRARLTPLGATVLALGVVALSTSWWPGKWLPEPVITPLGGVLVAAVAVAWAWSVIGLGRVAATWRLPSTVTARQEVAAAAIITGPGPLPALHLEAWDPLRRRSEVVHRLAPREFPTVRPAWNLRFARRGLMTLPGLVLITRLPFGLVEARRTAGDPVEILVLPAAGRLRRRARERLAVHVSAGGRIRRSHGEDLAHLRPYRPGDHPRAVHWRATARTGRLVVAEREAPQGHEVAVVLDQRAIGLEARVTLAATVLHRLAEGGGQPFLVLAGEPVAGDLGHLLEVLAMVQAGEAPSRPLPPGAVVLSDDPTCEEPGILRLGGEVLARAGREGL